MLFNSLAFAVFLPIVFFLYWAAPSKYRRLLLLIASYYFYMSWNVRYVALILFTTVVSYLCALCMEKKPQHKKICILTALGSCLGVLFVFKYCNFLLDTLGRIAARTAIPLQPMTLKLMLPVGISFYTFQTLSYVIDVYRGRCGAERDFVTYAAFVSFFPQLVAGPIERTQKLLPQIKAEHTFHREKAEYGLKLMAWGFFKKLVIADNLAVYVDQIFDDVHYYSGFCMVLAAFFFTFQIYCDFSGYSDIAIGCAKLFDIDLMTNFKSPYFSATLREFWTRWHISLSTWFRDYVYIPLGGNRRGKGRRRWNLFVTMTVSGLWHGAGFPYIAWGMLHGLLQILEDSLPFAAVRRERTAEKKKGGSGAWTIWLSRLVTFVAVMLAWVFFRANSLSDALYVLRAMATGIASPLAYLRQGFSVLDLGTADAVLSTFLPLGLLTVYDYAALTTDPIERLGSVKTAPRWILYYLFIFMVLLLASFNAQEFVYFQF